MHVSSVLQQKPRTAIRQRHIPLRVAYWHSNLPIIFLELSYPPAPLGRNELTLYLMPQWLYTTSNITSVMQSRRDFVQLLRKVTD